MDFPSGGKLDGMNLSISNKITKAARVVSRDYQRACAPLGVSPSQAGILYTLYHRGPLSQVDLACALFLEKTNINAMVGRLRLAELVSVESQREDRRKTLVHLTEKGRELAEKLIQVDQQIAQRYKDLAKDSKEFQAMEQYLDRVLEEFGRKG